MSIFRGFHVYFHHKLSWDSLLVADWLLPTGSSSQHPIQTTHEGDLGASVAKKELETPSQRVAPDRMPLAGYEKVRAFAGKVRDRREGMDKTHPL